MEIVPLGLGESTILDSRSVVEDRSGRLTPREALIY